MIWQISIREGMKAAEQRMKELQKLIENGENYLQYKPIHAELKKLKNGWTNKRDKYEEAHRAELTLWNAASRYLHANLTNTKTLPISKWKQEYADLKEQRDTDYTKLKFARRIKMKIAILGYSGSGKSTLARKLAELYQIDVLHFDTIQFLPDWAIRSEDEKKKITKVFLDTHDSWVIDGDYSELFYERRMVEADVIIFLLFNRFSCLYRAYRRYKQYKNETRPDRAEGCKEKFDLEFAKWILWDGRTKREREQYRDIILKYKKKAIVIKNQKELDRYILGLIN